MNVHKLLKITSAVVGILVAGMVLFCFQNSQVEDTKIIRDSGVYYTTDWNLVSAGNVKLPYAIYAKEKEMLCVSGTIPENVKDHYALSFRSQYSRIEVFVDDHLTASYGSVQQLPFGKLNGNIRVLVPIDSSMAGKHIAIYITPFYTSNMRLEQVEYGYLDDLKMGIIYENAFRVLVCIFLATVLLITIGLTFYQYIRKSSDHGVTFFYFGAFVFLVLIWLICSSDIPQLFTNANEAISITSFLALSMMAIPYVGYCRQILPTWKKQFFYLEFVGWSLPLLIIFCMIFKLCDPPDLLILTHLYIALAALGSFICACREWKRGADAKMIALSIAVIGSAAMAGIFSFYYDPSSGQDGNIFGLGIMIFTLMLFGLILFREEQFIKERKFMDVYKKLAYTDILTGLENRAAFDMKFQEMREKTEKGTRVTLFIFDLNYLKETNDTVGHQAGDLLIRGVGECIRRVFGRLGNCYRVGGDEFAVILLDQSAQAKQLIQEFDLCVQNYNQSQEHPVSAAVGYVEKDWTGEFDFQRTIFHEADEAMYEDKKRRKNCPITDKQ